MSTPINSLFTAKQLAVTYQPILLVDITQNDGTILHLASHDFTNDSAHLSGSGQPLTPRSFAFNGVEYLARITNQDLAATQALSEDGIDITPTVTLRIADPDQEIFTNFELNSELGFKGASMVLRLILVDMAAFTVSATGPLIGNFAPSYSSDSLGVFIGQCNPATQDNDEETTISAISKFNMKKILLPKIPIQKRCPWILPERFTTTDVNGNLVQIDQWAEASNYDSPFFPCGFDNGATLGNRVFPTNMTQNDWVKNPNHCNYTKSGCEKLGMYGSDSSGRQTGTYGGFQFDLAANNMMSWRGKSYIEGVTKEGTNNPDLAKYSTYVPLVYGTSWVDTIAINVLGDPNLTFGEALVCFGEVGNIIQVVVNDVLQVPGQLRYTGYTPDQLATIQSFLNSPGAPYPTITPVGPDTTNVPISFIFNSTPMLVDTAYPHGLRTGDQCYIANVHSDGIHGRHSANAQWAVIVNSPTQVALVGSSGNQDYTGGGTLSTQLPQLPSSVRPWNIINWGTRLGSPANVPPLDGKGDPYGNYCVFWYSVPSSVAQSNSLPRIRALVDGPTLPVFFGDNPTSSSFVKLGSPYNENPVWQLLDVLIRANWTYDQIDLPSFITAAAVCDAPVAFVDAFGNAQSHQRFACSFTIGQQKNAADIIRSLRQSCNAILIPNVAGKLKILIKQDIGRQQPSPILGSNNNDPITSGAPEALGPGFLAYDFTEADILRNGNKTTFKINQLPIQQAPNKVKVSFQDKENAYQQDSLTIVDDYDYQNVGEVQTMLQMDGPNSYDHVQRLVTTMMAEFHKGNPSAQSHGTLQFMFDTTYKAAHLNVGDLVRLTFLQRGIDRQLCRVISKQPSMNFEGVRITLQWHDDVWYSDAFGQGLIQDSGSLGQNTLNRLPYPWQPWEERPNLGDPLYSPHSDTNFNFRVDTSYQQNADGSQTAFVTVSGKTPINQFATKIRRPVVPPQGSFSATGGNFIGPGVYHVVLCGVDANGLYTAPSQPVRIDAPVVTTAGTLTINKIICDPGTVAIAAFVGVDAANMTFHSQVELSSTSNASITIVEQEDRTWGVPDVLTQLVRLKTKMIWHNGVLGVGIAQVQSLGGNQGSFLVTGAGWATNQWQGRQCIVSSNAETTGVGVGRTPIWEFAIVSNTSDTVVVTPDPTIDFDGIGVQAGDALVVRMRPVVTDVVSATKVITDPDWINSTNGFLEPVNVINVLDNGDATATIFTDGPHDFDGVRPVYVLGVNGANEVNGRWPAYVVPSPTSVRIPVQITSFYVSGGTTAEQVNGMLPHQEIGRMFRVIGGPGKGNTGIIEDNDNTSVTLTQPLKTGISSESICIIEEPNWRYQQESNTIQNNAPGVEMQMVMPVDNLEGETLLVMGFTVDGKGNECQEYSSPFREVYLVGAPGQKFIRDLLIKGIISDDPMAVAQDVMVNHYRVRCNPGEYVQLLDTAIQAKDSPIGADAIFDVLVSIDGGLTWDSIYVDPIHLTNNSLGNAYDESQFQTSKLYRDNLLRFDILQTGITNPGGQIEIDIKGKVFA